MKKCNKCKQLAELSEFGRCKRSKDGLKYNCNTCRRAERKFYKEKSAAWRANNKDLIKKYSKKYYSANRECLVAKSIAWANAKPEQVKAYKKNWYEANKERILANKKNRYKNDRKKIIQREWEYIKKSPLARLRHALRGRFSRAVASGYKSGSAVGYLGCSIEFFKTYLENKFSEQMSWANYGDWHIDHIRPLASFDLTEIDQVKEACHYTNLQPLWAKDNLSKGARWAL